MKNKEIYDHIHGYITLTPFAQQVCDTFEFQRLGYIKQLGVSSFVYPSADHSRKAHSFGCYHIARKMALSLQRKKPDIVSNRDVELLGIAGLVHDIGHGPFSHVFDKVCSSSHETRGICIFREMVLNYELPITSVEVEVIVKMIRPEGSTYWKYNIVSSVVDADRCDYIVRDARNVGVITPFGIHNIDRIIAHMDIENEKIIFNNHSHVSRDIYELLKARQALHHKVYQHPVSIAIEEMIVDIISLTNIPQSMNSSHLSVLKYTDSILLNLNYPETPIKGYDLINRIFNRKLYKVFKEIEYAERPLIKDNVDLTSICRWIGMDTGDIHPMRKVIFSPPLDIPIDEPHRVWKETYIIKTVNEKKR